MSSITEKAKNQKQVLTLNELSKRKVVEHNSLITSIAKMDKTPLKMFELAVSCINTEEPPKDNTVYLSKADLFAFFKVSDNDKHSRFKQAVRAMQKEAYFEIKEGIAQLVILPFLAAEFSEADALDATGRGAGGFGSTGR